MRQVLAGTYPVLPTQPSRHTAPWEWPRIIRACHGFSPPVGRISSAQPRRGGWRGNGALEHPIEVVGGATRLMQPQHAYHVLEVMLAVDESTRSTRAQGVNSTFDPLPHDPESIPLHSTIPTHDHRILRGEE